MPNRVVIGGAGGFMGQELVARFRGQGREVVTIGRRGSDLTWNDSAGLTDAVDGAGLVLGLAGKSVNCRYTPENRAEIFASRVRTTRALHDALVAATEPAPVWINSSTATIYRHAMDHPQTESAGELGRGFSVDVAKEWERELFEGDLPGVRRVAIRSAIVLGESGGVLATLKTLAKQGMGGTQVDGWWPVSKARRAAGTAHDPGARGGTQHFSWIHLDDVARAIEHIESTPALEGPVNLSSPHPVDNRTLMREVRQRFGLRIAPPLPRWALEIGAMAMRTETELILKSRWVLPERLEQTGFTFTHPTLADALDA